MSNSKDIFKALISEDLVNAKKFINNALLEKLGNSLEEKLVNFAPTVFNEEKGESEKKEAKKELSPNQMRIARMAGDKDKIDAEDFKALRRRGVKKESVETDQELESIAEEFEQELASLIEEIEQELGEELTEDEIKELADDLLDALNEQEETEDEEDEEDEEDTSVQKPMRNVGGDAY
jgi:hypothetical protein